MARPTIEIKQEHFENLCNMQCTLDEIAGFFHCSRDTIERWCKRTYGEGFADTYKKYSQNGKISLRRKQYEVAMKGNTTMLVWLGKQYLDQRERIEANVGTNDEKIREMQEFIKTVKGEYDA